MSIFVTQSSMPPFEEYVEEIKPIFERRHLTNMGPVYEKLRQQLIDYLEVPQLSMFVNGHMALELAVQALGLRGNGGEVITTPFTFISTTNAIVRNGLKPVFCDIKADDYTIDPEKIESLITEETKAIMPVHVYGNVCDVDAIQKIADKYGLKVIYDAAHAFGIKYRNVGIANYGDASMFSFHATKVFHTIEGGAIAFKDESYSLPMKELMNYGLRGEDVLDFGCNAKMDEFRAAMGICNLRRIDESIRARATAAKEYDERLGNVKGIRLPPTQSGATKNYAYYPVFIDKDKFGKSRDEVFEQLKAEDIFARKYFYPAINDMSCYKGKFVGETPIARSTAAGIMCLPLYENLAIEDVDRICNIIFSNK